MWANDTRQPITGQITILRIVPHARTLRKAREQVKVMIADGRYTQQIRLYLHRFVIGWVNASELWTYEELLESFIRTCWEAKPAAIAAYLLQRRIKELRISSSLVGLSGADCPAAA